MDTILRPAMDGGHVLRIIVPAPLHFSLLHYSSFPLLLLFPHSEKGGGTTQH